MITTAETTRNADEALDYFFTPARQLRFGRRGNICCQITFSKEMGHRKTQIFTDKNKNLRLFV
jgi:hypothetical protein